VRTIEIIAFRYHNVNTFFYFFAIFFPALFSKN
jgi:hypothetical protein